MRTSTQSKLPAALPRRMADSGMVGRIGFWLLEKQAPDAADLSRSPPKLEYRREIDGLRALAVIPVILFHAGFAAFGGGYVGVDVFFVISGYLITSLIISEQEAGRFSLLSFYERRMRRILPALLFVILCCVPLAWALMLPRQLEDFAQSVLANALFMSNFLFLRESGYFAAAAETKPLLHTWSLAVEEQFYIVFPALLLLAWRLGPRKFAAVLMATALASFAASEWIGQSSPETSFYVLPARAWELLIGALAAFYLAYAPHQPRRLDHVAAAAGLGLILFSIFGYDETTPFPSAYALAPTLGTALVILFARPRTWANRLLSLPLFVGIGLISYSAYLWHQPLLAFARIAHSSEIGAPLAGALAGTSMVLAWFSWRYVERPFRDKAVIARRHVFGGAAVAAIALLFLGIAGYVNHGFAGRWSPEALEAYSYAVIANPREHECNSDSHAVIWPSSACVYGNADKASTAILGDSHASVLAGELGRVLESRGLGLRQFTYNNCIPIPGLRRNDRQDACPAFNREVYRHLLEDGSIRTVVLASRWAQYLEGQRFDNGEGGIEPGRKLYVLPVEGAGLSPDDPRRIAAISAIIKDGIETLLQAGKRVVLVYPLPAVGWNLPEYMAREIAAGRSRSAPLSTSYRVYLERSFKARRALDAIGEHPNLIRFDPARLLCDRLLPERCVVELDGAPLYADENHVSRAGAKLMATAIVQEMMQGQTALQASP